MKIIKKISDLLKNRIEYYRSLDVDSINVLALLQDVIDDVKTYYPETEYDLEYMSVQDVLVLLLEEGVVNE